MSLYLSDGLAQEWQQVPTDQGRLNKNIKVDEELISHNADVYPSGKGQIDGAFGLSFSKPLPKKYIKKNLGWVVVNLAPSNLTYVGAVKPYDMQSYLLNPPTIPPLLRGKNIEYQVYVDFEDKPLWIAAKLVPKINDVITILTRKYGKPDTSTSRLVRFKIGSNQIDLVRGGSLGVLNYYAMANFQVYLATRNLKIRKKYTDLERSSLNPKELQIAQLADQMVELRQNLSMALGIDFNRRVGFRASPDLYSVYTPNQPLVGLGKGTYRIMVNPNLMPVSVHFELLGTEAALLKLKIILDHALEIAFGGFLKRTAKHSVLSLQGTSIAVLVRNGRMRLTILDSAENKAHNQRVKAVTQAKREAEALRVRKAEIVLEEGF